MASRALPGLLLPLILAAGAPSPARAASDTLDQSQTAATAVFADGVFPGAMDAQTFTAGVTGSVDRVAVYVAAVGASGPLTVTLEGTSVIASLGETFAAPDGTALAQSRVTVPTTAGWVYADFASPVPVTQGGLYAIVLSASGGYFTQYGTVGTGSYAGGQALHFGGGQWCIPGAGGDYAFQTFVVSSLSDPLATLARETAGLRPGHSLPAKVRAITADIEAGNTTAACGALAAFGQEVRAQTGKALAAPTAAQLLDTARQIRQAAGC